MSRILMICGTLLFLSACVKKPNGSRVERLPFYNESTFTPRWYSNKDQLPDDFHRIPSFSFLNQQGDVVTEANFENKIFVVDFFFTTCPGICPAMTANMDSIQRHFIENDDVLLLSHSVTPTIDTIEVLQAYAVEKGVNPKKWHLVTGDRSEIYNMGRKAYFVEEDLGEVSEVDDFLHTENFVLVDKNKYIRGIYNGLSANSVRQLILDMETLLQE